MDTDANEDNFKKLGILIEALTHSGTNILDEDLFKQVKKICKSSEVYISKIYELLLKQLKKKNSQIRLITFQMCKELFNRSALFREYFIKDLQLIYKLTTEIDSKCKLPPPKAAASNLKSLAILTLKNWMNEYGETYKKLKVAYNYFKNLKQVNFETLQVENSVEHISESVNENRQKIISEEKMKKLLEEINNNEPEIQSTVTSLSTCLNLLLPPLDDFFIFENESFDSHSLQITPNKNCSDNKTEVEQNTLRSFGITPDYKLSVKINPEDKIRIKNTDENSSVIENAKDFAQLLTIRYLPMVKMWTQTCSKYSNGGCNVLKQILDLKEILEKILIKYNSLIIEGGTINKKNVEDSSDDDFEEVHKEGYEEDVKLSDDKIEIAGNEKYDNVELLGYKCKDNNNQNILLNSGMLDNSFPEAETIDKPGTSKEINSPITTRKSKLLKAAPKLPFDIDLYHWEDENLTVPTLISSKMDVDKFWGCASSDDIHEIPNPEGVAALRTRVIEFTGKFEPVKWTCRAPLPSGKLCPRRDRYKCPFHGKIIPRNEHGICQNPEDEKNSKEIKKDKAPDWQDAEFLNDIKAATGVDLKIPEKKNKPKKFENINLTHKKMKTSAAALKIAKAKNFPGLVDVVRKQNNSYTRLSKKIFDRSSLKRVSTVLNKLDRNKYRDKFGDNFNYT